jgi:pyrroloquinoline quinone biosynthesis protein E
MKSLLNKLVEAYFEYRAEKKRNYPDVPREVMIEIEPRCNFRCAFCFNKLSFAKEGRDGIKILSADYVRKIIEKLSEAGVEKIRFTGGEPLLRNDIMDLLAYARRFDFTQIRLNTNASLIDREKARELVKYVDNFLIPIESEKEDIESPVCGFENALSRKINAVNWLREAGAKIIRIGTVATARTIENLEKIEELINTLPIDEWEIYRPIPFGGKENILGENDLELLISKFSAMAQASKEKYYHIANALPFCSVANPGLVDAISTGAFFDDGHARFVVDPRGFAKPHYFIDENIGDPLDPISCWNHPFMKKTRNLDFLPEKCRDCRFKLKCRGGSRLAAKITSGSYSALDPLANLSNIQNRSS